MLWWHSVVDAQEAAWLSIKDGGFAIRARPSLSPNWTCFAFEIIGNWYGLLPADWVFYYVRFALFLLIVGQFVLNSWEDKCSSIINKEFSTYSDGSYYNVLL